jgi:hypothetical protein
VFREDMACQRVFAAIQRMLGPLADANAGTFGPVAAQMTAVQAGLRDLVALDPAQIGEATALLLRLRDQLTTVIPEVQTLISEQRRRYRLVLTQEDRHAITTASAVLDQVMLAGILLDALEQVARYGLALMERPASSPLLDALGAALLRAWMAWPAAQEL